jgi:hypothetical protein
MVYASAHGDVALRFVREHQSLAGCWDEDGYLEWSGAARFDPGLQ